MTASTSTFTPEEMTLPSTRSASERGLAEQPKGMSTKPQSVDSLNSIRLTKSWIASTKNEISTIAQANQQHGDLDEVLEEADEAHQPRDGLHRACG